MSEAPQPINLKAERLNRGLSQRAMAEEIGITQAILVGVEAEGRRPQPAHAKKIADYFGVRVTDLWPLEEAA